MGDISSGANFACISGTLPTLVYPRAYRCIGINNYCQPTAASLNKWSNYELNMRRKAETLQFTQNNIGSSVKLPKKLLYSKLAKNQNNESLTWATQSNAGIGVSNPNVQDISAIRGPRGHIQYLRYPERLNNSSQNPSASGLPTHGFQYPWTHCGAAYELSYNLNVPLTNWIVQRTYGGGSDVPYDFGGASLPCPPLIVEMYLSYPIYDQRKININTGGLSWSGGQTDQYNWPANVVDPESFFPYDPAGTGDYEVKVEESVLEKCVKSPYLPPSGFTDMWDYSHNNPLSSMWITAAWIPAPFGPQTVTYYERLITIKSPTTGTASIPNRCGPTRSDVYDIVQTKKSTDTSSVTIPAHPLPNTGDPKNNIIINYDIWANSAVGLSTYSTKATKPLTVNAPLRGNGLDKLSYSFTCGEDSYRFWMLDVSCAYGESNQVYDPVTDGWCERGGWKNTALTYIAFISGPIKTGANTYEHVSFSDASSIFYPNQWTTSPTPYKGGTTKWPTKRTIGTGIVDASNWRDTSNTCWDQDLWPPYPYSLSGTYECFTDGHDHSIRCTYPLKGDTWYDISLLAINPLGITLISGESFKTPPGFPPPPDDVSATKWDCSSVRLTWKCPGLTNPNNYYYDISVSKASEYNGNIACQPTAWSYISKLSRSNVSITDTSYIITDLSCAFDYSFNVEIVHKETDHNCDKISSGQYPVDCSVGWDPSQAHFSINQPRYSKQTPGWEEFPAWRDTCGKIDVSFYQPKDPSRCINQVQIYHTITKSSFGSEHYNPSCSWIKSNIVYGPWGPPSGPPHSAEWFVKGYPSGQPDVPLAQYADICNVNFTYPTDYDKTHFWGDVSIGEPSNNYKVTIMSRCVNDICHNCDLSSAAQWDYSYCFTLDGSSSRPQGKSSHPLRPYLYHKEDSGMIVRFSHPSYIGICGGTIEDICGYMVVLTHNAAPLELNTLNADSVGGGNNPYFSLWNQMGDMCHNGQYRNDSSYTWCDGSGFSPYWIDTNDRVRSPYGISYNYFSRKWLDDYAKFSDQADFSYDISFDYISKGRGAAYRVDIYAQNDTPCDNSGIITSLSQFDSTLGPFPIQDNTVEYVHCTVVGPFGEDCSRNNHYSTPQPWNEYNGGQNNDPAQSSYPTDFRKYSRGFSSGISAEIQLGLQPESPTIWKYETRAGTNKINIFWDHADSTNKPDKYFLYVAGWAQTDPSENSQAQTYKAGAPWKCNPLRYANLDFSYNGKDLERYCRCATSDNSGLFYYNYWTQNTNYSKSVRALTGDTDVCGNNPKLEHSDSQPVWWLCNVFPGDTSYAYDIAKFNPYGPYNPKVVPSPRDVSPDDWVAPYNNPIYSLNPENNPSSTTRCNPTPTYILGASGNKLVGRCISYGSLDTSAPPNWKYKYTDTSNQGPPGWGSIPAISGSDGTYWGVVDGLLHNENYGGRWSFALVAAYSNKYTQSLPITKKGVGGIYYPPNMSTPFGYQNWAVRCLSGAIDASWDILSLPSNIIDISVGETTEAILPVNFPLGDLSAMYVGGGGNQNWGSQTYTGGLVDASFLTKNGPGCRGPGDPLSACWWDISGVEQGFDISYDTSILFSDSSWATHFVNDFAAFATMYTTNWSLDLSFNRNMIVKNVTTPHQYRDGSNHDFFWGKGYKKYNYTSGHQSQDLTTTAIGNAYDISHVNLRYKHISENYEDPSDGEIPYIKFGSETSARIRIWNGRNYADSQIGFSAPPYPLNPYKQYWPNVLDTNKHPLPTFILSNWTTPQPKVAFSDALPSWYIGGTGGSPKADNIYISAIVSNYDNSHVNIQFDWTLYSNNYDTHSACKENLWDVSWNIYAVRRENIDEGVTIDYRFPNYKFGSARPVLSFDRPPAYGGSAVYDGSYISLDNTGDVNCSNEYYKNLITPDPWDCTIPCSYYSQTTNYTATWYTFQTPITSTNFQSPTVHNITINKKGLWDMSLSSIDGLYKVNYMKPLSHDDQYNYIHDNSSGWFRNYKSTNASLDNGFASELSCNIYTTNYGPIDRCQSVTLPDSIYNNYPDAAGTGTGYGGQDVLTAPHMFSFCSSGAYYSAGALAVSADQIRGTNVGGNLTTVGDNLSVDCSFYWHTDYKHLDWPFINSTNTTIHSVKFPIQDMQLGDPSLTSIPSNISDSSWQQRTWSDLSHGIPGNSHVSFGWKFRGTETNLDYPQGGLALPSYYNVYSSTIQLPKDNSYGMPATPGPRNQFWYDCSGGEHSNYSGFGNHWLPTIRYPVYKTNCNIWDISGRWNYVLECQFQTLGQKGRLDKSSEKKYGSPYKVKFHINSAGLVIPGWDWEPYSLDYVNTNPDTSYAIATWMMGKYENETTRTWSSGGDIVNTYFYDAPTPATPDKCPPWINEFALQKLRFVGWQKQNIRSMTMPGPLSPSSISKSIFNNSPEAYNYWWEIYWPGSSLDYGTSQLPPALPTGPFYDLSAVLIRQL